MENNLLKKGYVMVSRALLQKVCEKQGAACCDEAAFLRVLINVNFKPAVVFCNGVEVQCARGESAISYSGWADLFGWTRGRTRRFFNNCFRTGLIEMVSDDCPSHIRIPGYDAWTMKLASAPKPKAPDAFEESLKDFLAYYSRTTHLPIENGSYVRSLWRKLSSGERQLAYKKVEDYYFSLNNTNYCYQVAKYLEYRMFENEFPGFN
ncbi:hypothetical protein [Bacteroides eggerthii]|jgi:hypothetical protein|uniref:Uncharacterized protein n=3 Tax=Bacteroides eggerthii TaxID=28111 RepID=A0A415RXW7_9BACE|nr:hypothetical protein [Bacteroides eggerthii]MDU6396332.1 hypothetical protein [Bacteroides sp.]EFV28087.1 hypothetical protein HMPREF1016_03706 [Bacteroides eggerthii 1_2_48FAA]KAA5267340.1 hypothetical protein F2Z23_19625 [Bacteroides eggerthii]KAA5280004.1 hypothetical protein F2Z10_19065 [Bacteroides eggerthii]MBS6693088.1 hypothetical protein [Bacteroides eggerthii]